MSRFWLFIFVGIQAVSLLACGGDAAETTAGNNQTTDAFTNPYRQCGTGFSIVPTDVQRLPAQHSVVIMGSSSAAGAGARPYEASWAGLYTKKQQLTGNLVQNIARGGHTTYHASPDFCLVSSQRFQPDPEHNLDRVLALEPDLVIISYPSNDMALGWKASESLSNILLIRAVLYEQGIASIVIGAQPRQLSSAYVAELVQFNNALKAQIGHCMVDVYDALEQNSMLNPNFDYGDAVHLNNAGHQLVFEHLMDVVNSQQCIVF